MPVDDAYKLLKATPSSTWESIEQTRRELVQQASPARVSAMTAEKRAQLQAEAKLSTVTARDGVWWFSGHAA